MTIELETNDGDSLASGTPTLRDWFAGQALAGYLAWSPGEDSLLPAAENAAKVAFDMADAMLAARASKGAM